MMKTGIESQTKRRLHVTIPRGEGTQRSFTQRGCAAMSNPSYPFIYHGVTPFVYLLLTDSTPLIYLVWTLIAVFAPTFEYKSITELGRFLVSFTSTKYMFVLFLVLLLTKRTDF